MHEIQTFLWDIGFYWSLSLSLVAVWISLYPISWICWGAWGWVHDNEEQRCHNRVAEWIALKLWDVSHKNYIGGDGDSQWWNFLCTGVLLFAFPVTLKFYEVTLFIVSIVTVMHLARFSIRHSKLFDKHVKDKEAHK